MPLYRFESIDSDEQALRQIEKQIVEARQQASSELAKAKWKAASLETKLDESQSRLAKAEAALKERLATVEKEVT